MGAAAAAMRLLGTPEVAHAAERDDETVHSSLSVRTPGALGDAATDDTACIPACARCRVYLRRRSGDCQQAGDAGHGPNFRLTFKAHGKTVTQSFAGLAARRK